MGSEPTIVLESRRGRIRYTKRDGEVHGVGVDSLRCVSSVFQSEVLSSSDVNKVFCLPPLVLENFHPSGYSSSIRQGFSPIDAFSLFLSSLVFFFFLSLPFFTHLHRIYLSLPSIAIIDLHRRRRRCAPIVITLPLVHSRGHFLAIVDPTLSHRISVRHIANEV